MTSRPSARASPTSSRPSSRRSGGKVTSYSGVAATDVDFSALITKLKGDNPDVVYYGGTMPAVALFLKQMRSLGLKATFFAADPAFMPDFITAAGPDVAAGSIVSFQAPPYDSTPALKDFAAKYKAAWKDDPGPYSAYGYNEAKIILEAMARAKPLNRETIVGRAAQDQETGPDRADRVHRQGRAEAAGGVPLQGHQRQVRRSSSRPRRPSLARRAGAPQPRPSSAVAR